MNRDDKGWQVTAVYIDYSDSPSIILYSFVYVFPHRQFRTIFALLFVIRSILCSMPTIKTIRVWKTKDKIVKTKRNQWKCHRLTLQQLHSLHLLFGHKCFMCSPALPLSLSVPLPLYFKNTLSMYDSRVRASVCVRRMAHAISIYALRTIVVVDYEIPSHAEPMVVISK